MSSTPLPPPTEEQMEALREYNAPHNSVREVIKAWRLLRKTGAWPYLAVLAKGLHVVYSLDGETLEPNGQWGLRADVFPVEEGASNDD